jgi:hypothetical protein
VTKPSHFFGAYFETVPIVGRDLALILDRDAPYVILIDRSVILAKILDRRTS